MKQLPIIATTVLLFTLMLLFISASSISSAEAYEIITGKRVKAELSSFKQ